MLALAAGACAPQGNPSQPAPGRADAIARPLEVYTQLGLLTGTPDYPAVASISTMAGPGDSTYVLLGLSLPNSALRFQREGSGFVSRYSVEAEFRRDGEPARTVTKEGVVRVRDFDETDRTDESVVFQDLVALAPGDYVLEVTTRDEASTRGAVLGDSVHVPAYAASGASISEPLFVYRAAARASRRDRPDLILNPRHTVYYGAVPPKLYLEAYGMSDDQPVRVRVVNDRDEEQWSTEVAFRSGSGGVAHAIVDIPAESLPLGRLWVEVDAPGTTATAHRSPLIVTISDQWIVANFDQMVEFLEYIATSEEVDSLRNATGVDRQELWTAFWDRRDPVPATAANEFRERFFERIRAATIYFGEPGTPGWETDRGEVYIVLGPPDGVFEDNPARRRDNFGRPERLLWVFERVPGGRLELVFEDRHGFGSYELTPSSQSRFRTVAERVKRRTLRSTRNE